MDQVGLGSVFSGKVLKHESSGNDLLSSYNSNHSVLGSTQFGAIGYNLGFMTIHVGYTSDNPLSVDTQNDLEEVKKIMEKK